MYTLVCPFIVQSQTLFGRSFKRSRLTERAEKGLALDYLPHLFIIQPIIISYDFFFFLYFKCITL